MKWVFQAAGPAGQTVGRLGDEEGPDPLAGRGLYSSLYQYIHTDKILRIHLQARELLEDSRQVET